MQFRNQRHKSNDIKKRDTSYMVSESEVSHTVKKAKLEVQEQDI